MTRRDVLAATGWVCAVLVVPVAVDWYSFRHDLESMSGLYGRLASHPVAGPFVVGASAGLLYHLGQSVEARWRT